MAVQLCCHLILAVKHSEHHPCQMNALSAATTMIFVRICSVERVNYHGPCVDSPVPLESGDRNSKIRAIHN
jgi:hypothetical protein